MISDVYRKKPSQTVYPAHIVKLVGIVSGSKELYAMAEKGEDVKMCRALDEIKEEGRQKGLSEGVAKGKALGRTEGLAEGKALGRTEGKLEGISFAKQVFVLKRLYWPLPYDTFGSQPTSKTLKAALLYISGKRSSR